MTELSTYDKTRISTLQGRALRGSLDDEDQRELATLVMKLALTEPEQKLEEGEIRLADKADEVGAARAALTQARHTFALLTLGPVVSLGLLGVGVVLNNIHLLWIGAALLIMGLFGIGWFYHDGRGMKVSDAETAVRRAEVEFARLQRRLPDAIDRQIAAKQIES